MPNRVKHWCPTLCGKSVLYATFSHKEKNPFFCDRCKTNFSYEDLGKKKLSSNCTYIPVNPEKVEKLRKMLFISNHGSNKDWKVST